MKKRNNKGFSLVELIIVIAIMAVLIGVLAPQFIKYVERSREATDLQNIESMKRAIDAYMADSATDAIGLIQVDITNEDQYMLKSVLYSSDPLGGAGSFDNVLAQYGIKAEEPLKSKKWKYESSDFFSWAYIDYKWVLVDGTLGDEITDDNMPHADYFYIDGTPYEAD